MAVLRSWLRWAEIHFTVTKMLVFLPRTTTQRRSWSPRLLILATWSTNCLLRAVVSMHRWNLITNVKVCSGCLKNLNFLVCALFVRVFRIKPDALRWCMRYAAITVTTNSTWPYWPMLGRMWWPKTRLTFNTHIVVACHRAAYGSIWVNHIQIFHRVAQADGRKGSFSAPARRRHDRNAQGSRY